MMPLVGTAVAKSSAGSALPVYFTTIAARGLAPGPLAHTSAYTMSGFSCNGLRVSPNGLLALYRRARIEAMVSPDWRWLHIAGDTPAGVLSTT